METKKKNVLRAYFRWPFFLGILLVLATTGAFFWDKWMAIMFLAFTLIYYSVALIFYLVYRRSIPKKLVDFASSYAQVQNQLLRRIDIPFAMCSSDGELFWYNPSFAACFDLKKQREASLSKLFPALENVDLRSRNVFHLEYGDKKYVLNVSAIDMEAVHELSELDDSEKTRLFSVYLIDETELLSYQQLYMDEKNVMALIYLDNYDEVMEGVEYVRRSLLSALLERKLNKYAGSVQAVVRKLEKDRFLLVLRQESLQRLQDGGFSLLEDIKTVNIGNEMSVTISMGIGMGGESVEKNYEYASAAIDMALARGGDQAVLKEGTEIRYFGGNVKTAERSTRVKARIKANALRELVEARDSVIIMGHPIGDMDCFGAAMGVYRLAKFSGKKAHIVTGELNSSVRPLMAMFQSNNEYDSDLFVNHQRAMELLNRDTLLVVVDTNRPSYTECPDLLKRTQNVVVMDHHRQGRERIENALLSYVEPYASSASEMVAEVVQYYDEKLKLRPQEADAMLAGIVMDTNNFEDKAGVRTFEAAAYLRRCGADVTRVRKLFRESMDDYKLRAETISRAELFEKDYIISICPSVRESRNQTVIAAQAANELLEIRDVKASFVFTEFDGRIYLSARSIDEINVQVLMEKLGGGGHASIAGAQFQNIQMDEAVSKLKEVLTAGTGMH